MTTLPQTTPIRLPRPTGPSQLAVPSYASQGPAAPSFQMSGGDVWRVIRANLWLIILCVVVSGVAGFYTNGYLAQHYSTYTATGLIRILPLQSNDPLHPSNVDQSTATLAIEQKTEASILKSDGLINEVLSDSTNPIRQTTWWTVTCNGEPTKARRLLADRLTAASVLESQLISVAMSAPDPRDTKIIVTAVVDQAIKDKRDFIRSKNEADRNRLVEQKTRYETLLRDASKDVEDLGSKLNLNGIQTSGGIGSKELELHERVKAQLEMQSVATAAENAYNGFIAQLQKGEEPIRVTDLVNQDQTVNQYKQLLTQADLQINDAAGTKLGSSNPMLLQLQSRRDMYQKKYDDARAESALRSST